MLSFITKNGVISILLFQIMACAPRYAITVDGPPGYSDQSLLAIYELVLRNLYTNANVTELYLSLGNKQYLFGDIVKRVVDMNLELKPISDWEKLTVHPDNIDKRLLSITIVKWHNTKEAHIRWYQYLGLGLSLGPSGRNADLKWSKGKWVLYKRPEMSVS